MKIIFFGFSLNKNTQLQLPIIGNKSKKEILSEVLKINLEYKYHGDVLYKYNDIVNDYIIGEIGRKSTKLISTVGENSFKDEEIPHYPHAKIIFNLLEDYEKGGHRVGFEHKYDLFSNPEGQIEKFEEKLNTKLKDYGYSISFYPLSDETNFWTYIGENKGKVEKLTFTYSVPNFLGLTNSLTDDLKEAYKKYGITNSTLVLENKNGVLNIEKEDELISQSVEYASKGAGEYKIKLKGVKAEYSSNKNIKTLSVDEIDISGGKSSLDKIFANLL